MFFNPSLSFQARQGYYNMKHEKKFIPLASQNPLKPHKITENTNMQNDLLLKALEQAVRQS